MSDVDRLQFLRIALIVIGLTFIFRAYVRWASCGPRAGLGATDTRTI